MAEINEQRKMSNDQLTLMLQKKPPNGHG